MRPPAQLLAFVAVAVTATACGSARASAAPPDFRTPSGNIACAVAAGWLRCEISSGLQPKPPRPASCPLDWGDGVIVSRKKPAVVLCAGDTIRLASMPVLAYGRTWRRGGFVCASRVAGLTCTAPSGHGFFLSRQRWRTF